MLASATQRRHRIALFAGLTSERRHILETKLQKTHGPPWGPLGPLGAPWVFFAASSPEHAGAHWLSLRTELTYVYAVLRSPTLNLTLYMMCRV